MNSTSALSFKIKPVGETWIWSVHRPDGMRVAGGVCATRAIAAALVIRHLVSASAPPAPAERTAARAA
jgi:hypothetical protein